jgi:hypothetical protein
MVVDLLWHHHSPRDRRVAFSSVTDLNGAITNFLDNWNTECLTVH